jgi:hypothetical protein
MKIELTQEAQHSYFVIAAIIAKQLSQATQIAKNLSLTSSNARAVALRAGESAAGFKPLTEFIDQLAALTINYSANINSAATELSQVAVKRVNAKKTKIHLEQVYIKAKDSKYIHSLDNAFTKISNLYEHYETKFNHIIFHLIETLTELKSELRTATILATLSRVEASRSGHIYEADLNHVADNVETSTQQIKALIENAIVNVRELGIEQG